MRRQPERALDLLERRFALVLGQFVGLGHHCEHQHATRRARISRSRSRRGRLRAAGRPAAPAPSATRAPTGTDRRTAATSRAPTSTPWRSRSRADRRSAARADRRRAPALGRDHHAEEVDEPRAPRRAGDAHQAAPLHERLQQRRLADVRAAGERNLGRTLFGPSGAGRLFRRRGEEVCFEHLHGLFVTITMSMRVIGLTGGIASGKSTAARTLAELGARVVDADRVAREIVAPGQPALAEIVRAFGRDMLLPDGTLDRKRLGARRLRRRRQAARAQRHHPSAHRRGDAGAARARCATRARRSPSTKRRCWWRTACTRRSTGSSSSPATRRRSWRASCQRDGYVEADARARIAAQAPHRGQDGRGRRGWLTRAARWRTRRSSSRASGRRFSRRK